MLGLWACFTTPGLLTTESMAFQTPAWQILYQLSYIPSSFCSQNYLSFLIYFKRTHIEMPKVLAEWFPEPTYLRWEQTLKEWSWGNEVGETIFLSYPKFLWVLFFYKEVDNNEGHRISPNVLLKNFRIWGGGDGSEVNSTCCSSRGHEFCSRHLLWVTHNCQKQEIQVWCSALAFKGFWKHTMCLHAQCACARALECARVLECARALECACALECAHTYIFQKLKSFQKKSHTCIQHVQEIKI